MTLTATASAMPAFLDGKTKLMLIDGKWTPSMSGRTFETRNPSNGDVLATIAEGRTEDVDLAVAAARRAFEGPWRRMKPAERTDLMLKWADLVEQHYPELRMLDVLDMGSPIGAGRGPSDVLNTIRYYAGWCTKIHGETMEPSVPGSYMTYTLKEPVGVVASIIPWNAPLRMAIWKLSTALATGCTIILKPAEEACLSSLRLGELIQEAGIPEGVVNILPGFGETCGAPLAEHHGVDKVAFTGSHITGQQIVRASAGNLKRVSLELGGKSPDIVFADADLEAAVPGAAMSCFANAGQICAAGTRLFVERSVYPQFVERVAGFAKTLKVGDSLDPSTQIGPIVSEQQLERVTGYLRAGVDEGALTLAGGRRLTDGKLAKGFFVEPTVFADVKDEMSIARDEIFGPVLSVLPFDGVEEVARRSNATHYGLASFIWTRNVGTAHRLAKALQAGSVWINCRNIVDPAVPFGGYKMSGYGREFSSHSLDDYLNVKAVWINTDA